MTEKKLGVAKALGNRLKQWRKASKLRTAELADMIEISQGSLSDLENNKSLPSADTLAKLYRYTDLDIFWLMFNKGSMRKGQTFPLESSPYVLDSFEEYKKTAIIPDQNLKEMVEALIRVYKNGGSDKVSHLKGFLMGADPGE